MPGLAAVTVGSRAQRAQSSAGSLRGVCATWGLNLTEIGNRRKSATLAVSECSVLNSCCSAGFTTLLLFLVCLSLFLAAKPAPGGVRWACGAQQHPRELGDESREIKQSQTKKPPSHQAPAGKFNSPRFLADIFENGNTSACPLSFFFRKLFKMMTFYTRDWLLS